LAGAAADRTSPSRCGGAIETAMVARGEIRLDPFGITLNVAEIYAD
jgi:hypothetical protein